MKPVAKPLNMTVIVFVLVMVFYTSPWWLDAIDMTIGQTYDGALWVVAKLWGLVSWM